MQAHSIDKKTFQLTENHQVIGEIFYENLFFLTAEIKLAGPDILKIKPAGIFQTSIKITKNDIEIAELAMNWRGEIVISFQDGQEYIFKLNRFFSGRYTIENRHQEKIIQLNPKFNWRTFQYSYDIAYEVTVENSADPLLLLLGVYAANYFVACMSGASAGMM